MASTYTPVWKQRLIRWVPWLFSKCPGGNYHWRWDLTCFCVINENAHGMFYRRNNDDAWHECPRCIKEREILPPLPHETRSDWTELDREVI